MDPCIRLAPKALPFILEPGLLEPSTLVIAMVLFPNSNCLITRHMPMGKICLDILPVDVFVDNIISLLEIQDVLALRRVSKFFYKLSRTDVIWKRLLARFEGPIPPLPPTSRYSLHGLKGIEAERIILRSLSFDRNWRSNAPDTCHSYSFKTHDTVLSMILLPGGHYLVASLTDATRTNYFIAVFVMDYRGGNAYQLAKTPIKTKAYDLQAKYLRIYGQQGITITFIRREFKKDQPGLDICDFSDKYEIEPPPYPIRYQCVALHISLEHLEKLGDADFWPGSPEFYQYADSLPLPFRDLAEMRSHRKLSCPYVEYIHGIPYLSLILHPDTVIYKDLERGKVSRLQCLPWDEFANHDNVIVAIRNIPFENKVFVIKKVESPTDHQREPKFSFEFYKIPARGLNVSWDAQDGSYWYEGGVRSFQISELGYPSIYNESMQTRPNPGGRYTPPTIYVYCRGRNPEKFLLCAMPPTLGQTPPDSALFYSYPHLLPDSRAALYPPHFYEINEMKSQCAFRYPSNFGTAFILPGRERAVAWSIPSDNRIDTPPLKNLWSFVKLDHEGHVYMADETPKGRRGKKRKAERDNSFSTITLETVLWDHFDRGIQAMAWDESIGRICIAAAGNSQIYVLDFGHNAREDARGNRLPRMN